MCGCVALGILFLFKQVDVAEWQPGLLLCHINLLFFGWLTVFYSIQHCRPRSVIPSLRSRASSERSEGSLTEQRSFAALRMTKRDGLFFEMYWGFCITYGNILFCLCLMEDGKKAGRWGSTW